LARKIGHSLVGISRRLMHRRRARGVPAPPAPCSLAVRRDQRGELPFAGGGVVPQDEAPGRRRPDLEIAVPRLERISRMAKRRSPSVKARGSSSPR
jgi:hypothetical protein